MAGINSTIRINDAMSPALKSMNKALNIVLNNFEKMQRVSGNAIDVADIRDARTELTNAAVAVNKLESELRQAKSEQERLTQEAKETDSVMGNLTKKIGGVVAAYATFQTLLGAGKLSDQMTQIESRINLIVNTDSGETLEGLEQKIMESANRSRASYAATADSVVKLANNAGHAFSSNDEIIMFLEAVNKQFVIGGADASAMAGAMTQLTQGLAAGALRGDELNSVLEGAPGIARAIEKSMGWAQGSIKQYAEEGLVTAEVVKNAMLGSLKEIDTQFNTMPMTWGQLLTVVKNNAVEALDPLLQKINDLANNPSIQTFAANFVSALSGVANVLGVVIQLAAGVGNFLADNWSVISPIIWGVVSAIAAYNAIKFVQNLMDKESLLMRAASTVATIAHGAALVVAGVATGNMTLAQHGLNMAMKANPILFVVSLIAILVTAISAWIKKIGGLKIAWLVVMNAIKTAWDWVQIGLLTGFFAVMNFLDKFAYAFKAVGVAIANFIGDMKVNVLEILQGMVNGAIGLVNGLIKSLNKLPFVSISTISEVTFATTAAAENEAAKQQREAQLRGESINMEENKAAREQLLSDMKAEARAGTAARQAEISQARAELARTDDGTASYEEMLATAQETADNTGAIKDGLDIAEEDLKYMRDMAEQEAINRFTTAEIKIDMQNNNSIASGMDIDGIVMQLEDKLYESMTIAAEGAY